MPLVFGDYTLDIDRRELSRGGERVALAPQVFDLLVYIVRNRDHVVSKDDLIEAVWDGRIVSESAVTTRLNALRNAIGDSGAEQRLIRTVSRRGVRFVGEVREENGLPIAAALTSEPPRARTSTRRLAAILAADVAGYSRLIGVDKEGTLSRLKGLRAEVVDPKISEHHGRIVKTTGDGLLVEFASVVDALRCATEIQAAMAESNAPLPADKRIDLRIGINMGEIVVEDGEIFGDGVNVAARLEGLAEPGGICVSARVQEDAEGRVDLAFEDMGEQVLRNIARPVRAYRVRTTLTRPDANAMGSPLSCNAREDAERQGREAGKGGSPELPLPDKPSIALLPFQNMSGDPEQEYFADGMVEEIITALSRIRWLFVIARNSTFTYKGQAVDVKQIGRELGVQYVLEGSVRKAGGRVRITAQLIDATTGTHLWADRFDGSWKMYSTFRSGSRSMSPESSSRHCKWLRCAVPPRGRRSTSQPTTSIYARLAFFPTTKERILASLALLEQAIAIDRHYGPALSWAAICHLRLVVDGFVEAPETSRRKAIDLARLALRAEENHAGILANAAFVLAYFGEDVGAMIGLIDRALALNPSFARGWYLSGLIRVWAGQHELAIEHVETSLRLSPHSLEHMGLPLFTMGTAYFFRRQFDDAASKLILSVQDNPSHSPSYRFLAACYAHMGRLDEARAIVTRLGAITPQVVPTDLPWRNPEDCELLLSGLRLATGETARCLVSRANLQSPARFA